METKSDEKELLLANLSEVLPDNFELSSAALIGILSDYVSKFQALYSWYPTDDAGNYQVARVTMRLRDLQRETSSNLNILDSILPIQKTASEIIPWDISDYERDHSIEGSSIYVSWPRYVEALGKYMAGAYPTIYTNNNQ